MPIIVSPQDFNVADLFVDLRPDLPLYLKCEGFNFAGSVKLKAAVEMVAAAERAGDLRPGTRLVESSSGNLGIALSMVARSNGFSFTCVTDVRCNAASVRLMRALGAEVHVVGEPHPERGFLGARLDHIARLCAGHPDFLWLNQYANEANWLAHHQTTGPEIIKSFPEIDVLFVGAGTTGTLMGCARYLREARPSTRVVAIETEGSVAFGGPPATRLIPGMGTGIRPPLLDESLVDDVVHVSEVDTVRTCRSLAERGFLFGGSTGTVVSGAGKWLRRHGGRALTAVAVAPDFGERYLDTVYDDSWVAEHYSL